MAHYLVSARLREERLAELRKKLEEGAFEDLSPFSRELTRALRGAKVRPDGLAVWEEEDYCSPPLAQEREAVLDRYFEGLDVRRVEPGAGWEEIDDLPALFGELERELET